jgi:tetratricopeptide (TPR) repeat protein
VDFYETGKLKEAATLGRRIVAERPQMQTGYEFLSLAQEQLGDDTGAIQTLEAGRRRGVLSESVLGRLGLLYAERNESGRALQILEPLSHSSDVEVLNALGIARTGAGDRGGALAAFKRALEIDPRNAIADQNIGIAELQFGRTQDALAAFERAFALNASLPRAWNADGVALERSGRPAEALDAWKRAVAIDPSQFDALFNIGLVATRLKRFDDARQAFGDFAARAPADRYGPDIARARGLLAALEKAHP